MSRLSASATWIQRSVIFLVLPTMFIIRLLSWWKINADTLYLQYQQLAEASSMEHDLLALPLSGKYLFFVIETLPLFFVLAALYYFWNILELYKKGMHFSRQTVRLLQKINICMLIWALYQLFFDTLASLVISLFRPEGQRYIRLSIEADDIMRFFALLILFVVLQMVKEAHNLQSEQDLVV
jgi:hypothetical protein